MVLGDKRPRSVWKLDSPKVGTMLQQITGALQAATLQVAALWKEAQASHPS